MNAHSHSSHQPENPPVRFRDLEGDICDLDALVGILMELQDAMFDHPDKTEGTLHFYSVPKGLVEGRVVLMTQVARQSERLRERYYAAFETERADKAAAKAVRA